MVPDLIPRECEMKKAAILSALLASGAAAAAAVAQTPAEAPATTKLGPNQDPNQVVCQTQTEIGSRVNRRRVCRTRAEWEEHQRMYRQNIERAQQQMQTSGD
jgi:invasion protein IalB